MNAWREPCLGQYLAPTPGGAYYAASHPTPNVACKLLFALMALDASPLLDIATARHLSACDDDDDALTLLNSAQRLGLVQSLEAPRRPPAGDIVDLLPDLISRLSSKAQALVADAQGFQIASHGFPGGTADELSALSADLATLDERRQGARTNLRLAGHNWGIIDASGNSQLGFWPLSIGMTRFVLVVGGVPAFNQPDYADLIWVLCRRYNR